VWVKALFDHLPSTLASPVAAGAARSRIRLFEEAGIAVMMWHMPVMAMCATSMTTTMCTAALATATSTIPCCIVIIFIIIVDAAIAMTIAIAFAIAIAMAIAAASASLSTAINAAAVAAVARAPISTAIAAAAAEAVVVAVAVAVPVASASASLSTAINAAAVAIAAASASLSTAISAAAIAIAAALSAAWSAALSAAALSAAALSPTTARNRLQTRRARPTVAFLSPPHHIVGGNRQSIRYSSCIPSGRCSQDDSLLSHAGLMLPELIIVNIGHLLTYNHVTFCSRPQNSNALFECICGWNLFRLCSLEAQRWQTSCTIRNPLESSVIYADGSLRLSPMRSGFSWFGKGLVWSCCT
jgi:hypothetical protein